ncbi:MAG: chorismate-binding protein [Candidatus Peribacteraceae bacterium]|nr:chorismate-binding protein [Candidatus Peribacteraceae bacterium]
MNLNDLRAKIDATDAEILKLIARRQNLAAEIAAAKRTIGKKVFDPAREKKLLAEKKKLATELGVPTERVEKIFRALFETSRSAQSSYFELARKLTPKKIIYREKKIKTDLSLLEIFARLRQNFATCFLLESLGKDADFSRQSFIGFAPHAVISAEPGKLIVDKKVFATPNPYLALKNFLPKIPKGRGFRGGLFGYLTYEATRYFEPSVQFKKHPDFPDFEFGLYFDGLIFDKKTGDLKYFYLSEDRSQLLKKILTKKLKPEKKFRAKFLGHNTTQKAFEQKVRLGQKEIFAGNTFQFQYGRKSYFDLSGDRMEFYAKLREVNPSPHMFYLKFGDELALRSSKRSSERKRELIGSSPELIVRVENGKVENYPLAGTRKITGDKKRDAEIARELLADEKERAEHMMLVDLGRNDVGRVSEFGSVRVPKLMQIKRFSHVQHIGSEIVGKLRQGLTAFDALATNTPVGTVSGAPKIETMKIIERLEKDPRGPYAGAVGFFSLTGDCVFAANLRSLFAAGEKATVQASAGIVADSVPKHEFGEVEKKVRGVITALKEASK